MIIAIILQGQNSRVYLNDSSMAILRMELTDQWANNIEIEVQYGNWAMQLPVLPVTTTVHSLLVE